MHSCNCCQPSSVEFKKITKLSMLLKLIGEENRLKLLCLLKHQNHCVCDILKHFEMSQSLISHHLIDLKNAGIVKSSKQGRRVTYTLTKQGKKITENIFSLK